MTTAAVAPATSVPSRAPQRDDRAGRGKIRREASVRMTATTAPDVRRPHPGAPCGRPGGAPAPTLRRGAMPEHLRPLTPVSRQPIGSSQATAWRLTDRAIGLMLAIIAVLMLTSIAVVVAKAVQVTSPDSAYSASR